ncbi:hypothetical protein BDZ91DRAFT_736179 [Kalaharituber pfeilii]|nr:hypothetical protein BDZ91DRAFT_736179 [Kalaharituber pfeilii]
MHFCNGVFRGIFEFLLWTRFWDPLSLIPILLNLFYLYYSFFFHFFFSVSVMWGVVL